MQRTHPQAFSTGKASCKPTARARTAVRVDATSSLSQRIGAGLMATLASTALLLGPAGPAFANKERIAEFAASGLIFKDNVEVYSFEDPEVSGVTLYFSDFKRSLTDKLAKDFFTEPSQASLGCAATGPTAVKDIKRIEGSEGKEVLSEKKGLNFFTDKTLRVRRVYDAEREVLVYVSYSTRLAGASSDGGVSSGRYRTSTCVVPLRSAFPIPAPLPAPTLAVTPAP